MAKERQQVNWIIVFLGILFEPLWRIVWSTVTVNMIIKQTSLYPAEI